MGLGEGNGARPDCLGSKATRREQEMKGAHTEKKGMKSFPVADGITF